MEAAHEKKCNIRPARKPQKEIRPLPDSTKTIGVSYYLQSLHSHDVLRGLLATKFPLQLFGIERFTMSYSAVL